MENDNSPTDKNRPNSRIFKKMNKMLDWMKTLCMWATCDCLKTSLAMASRFPRSLMEETYSETALITTSQGGSTNWWARTCNSTKVWWLYTVCGMKLKRPQADNCVFFNDSIFQPFPNKFTAVVYQCANILRQTDFTALEIMQCY